MKKILTGVLPVLVLYLVQRYLVSFETLQLWVAAGTLPFAVTFLIAYIPERPWTHWFGTSLLLIAAAVLLYSSSVVLFRILGPDYPGRAEMVTFSVGLTFTAMVMRTWVLLSAQHPTRARGKVGGV